MVHRGITFSVKVVVLWRTDDWYVLLDGDHLPTRAINGTISRAIYELMESCNVGITRANLALAADESDSSISLIYYAIVKSPDCFESMYSWHGLRSLPPMVSNDRANLSQVADIAIRSSAQIRC